MDVEGQQINASEADGITEALPHMHLGLFSRLRRRPSGQG